MQDDERIKQNLQEFDKNYSRQMLAYNLYRNIAEVTRMSAENSEEKAGFTKKQFDKGVKGADFKPGDCVMLLVERPGHKFAKRFRRSYTVEEQTSEWNYIVNVGEEKKITNITKMKAYEGSQGGSITVKDSAGATSTSREEYSTAPEETDSRQKSGSRVQSSDSDEDRAFTRITRSRKKKMKKRKNKEPHVSAVETEELKTLQISPLLVRKQR